MIVTMKSSSLIAAILVCILSPIVAQNVETPLDCQSATGLNFNNTELFGAWFEVLSHPSAKNVSCVEVDVSLKDSNTLTIKNTYSTGSMLSKNQTIDASLALVTNQTAGYNITYSTSDKSIPAVFVKLLAINKTSDNSFLIGCGLRNASDNATNFGFILSQKRSVNRTTLDDVNTMAASKCTVFQSGNYSAIVQSDLCYTSSATSIAPIVTSFLALIFVLLKGV